MGEIHLEKRKATVFSIMSHFVAFMGKNIFEKERKAFYPHTAHDNGGRFIYIYIYIVYI